MLLEEPTNDSVDWIKAGAVTNIRNQGKCGSCWAHSTVGAVEGTVFIRDKVLFNLSEQQLVDCSLEKPNDGCFGGVMSIAMSYVAENPLMMGKDYPYEGLQHSYCNYKKVKGLGRISGP